MPTYQYACTVADCGHEFERVQSFSDDALTECPVCAGRLRKVWGSIGVVFKGTGFYRNDSRAAAGKAKNGDGASKPDSGATSGAKSESGSTSGSGKNDATSGKSESSAAKKDASSSTPSAGSGSSGSTSSKSSSSATKSSAASGTSKS